MGRAALDHLTQQQRQVLELSDYQGNPGAKLLNNWGYRTVKSWAGRGLLRLRSHLQDQLREAQRDVPTAMPSKPCADTP